MPETIADILRRANVEDMSLGACPLVSPETTLEEVCGRLGSQGRSAVVVADGGRVVGIFTERDLLYRAAEGPVDLASPIADLMTPSPRTLRAGQPLAEALEAMIEGGYRQLPVVDSESRPRGLLTTRDVLSFIARRFPEETLNLPPRLHQLMATPEGA